MNRSRVWALIWTIVRLGAAALLAAAVVVQARTTITDAAADGLNAGTVAANFFSFFTIQSAVLAVVVLGWASLRVLGGARTRDPVPLAVLLACASSYMIVTGVVYTVLLRGLPGSGPSVPWADDAMHVIGPIVLALDVLLGPYRRALRWRAVWWQLLYPIAWVIYTLLRAPWVTDPYNGNPYWYPYPFLNPHNPDQVPPGFGGVAVYVAAIALGVGVLATIVVVLSKIRGHPRAGGVSGAEASPTAG